jgi:hypothetical protein
VAVGGINQAFGMLIETLSGGQWHATVIPATHRTSEKYLGAVTCVATSSCVAVGTFGTGTSMSGVAATLAGQRWTTKELPLPDNARGIGRFGLGSIWCQSVRSCVATGTYGSAAGGSDPLAEVLSDGTWTSVALPTPPAPDQQSFLNGLSCTSITSCVAVGSSDGTPLVESLSGTTWTSSSMSMPPEDTSVLLESVSCPTPDSCVAVGSGTGPGGTYPVMATFGK